jgi:zinc transport system substrate-binding protein
MVVMMLRRLPTSIALTATAAVGALVLTACGGSSSAKDGGGKLEVTASFYPMEFLASKIGGEHVNVTDLTAAGTEPHDLELTAKQVAKVKDAGLVVYLKGLQPTVDKAVAQSDSKHVVDATAASPLVDHHLPAEEGEDEEHKDEPAGDPHIWLDPSRYATVAKSVGAELAKADPSHAADYQKNTDQVVADLAALDQEFKAGLKDFKGKSFVTSHAAFGYLAEAYGVNQIPISGVDPEAEPTPARLAEIQRAAKEHGVSTIFFETLVSPKLAETVAKDLGLKTAVLDPLEGVKDPAKDNYFTVMRANLANLKTAFGTTG